MCESTEDSSWTVTSLLYVIALGRFVNFRMELLFRARMTINTVITLIAIAWFAPFFSMFDVWTGGRAILVLPGAPSLVLTVVVLGAGVTLPAQSGRSLAGLGLVVAEHVGRVLPLGVLVHEVALLVEDVGPVSGGVGIEVRILHRLDLLDIVDRRPEVVVAMGEGAVRPVFNAVAPRVRVVDAHAGLVIAQVVASLRVARSAM